MCVGESVSVREIEMTQVRLTYDTTTDLQGSVCEDGGSGDHIMTLPILYGRSLR